MYLTQIFKKCLIPATAVVVEAKLNSQGEAEDSICRPSELPIYTPETHHSHIPKQDNELPNALENGIRETRQTVNKYIQEVQAYKRVGVEHFDRSKESLDGWVSYLREENNMLPKAGAIGIGTLTGLIFGLRGGFFKRTLYATTGALGMAAVCYPKEAAEYSQVGLTEAKKYLTIAYNFAYGVKKEDPPLELPSLPKIPTNFSDIWETVKSTATSFVSDVEQKATETGKDQVIGDSPSDTTSETPTVRDPLDVVTKSRDNAISKSCHCPVGACLGHPDSSTAPSQNVPAPPQNPVQPVCYVEDQCKLKSD